MTAWLNRNKKWVFSGVGVAAATTLFTWWLTPRPSLDVHTEQQLEVGQGVAAGRDLNVSGNIRIEQPLSHVERHDGPSIALGIDLITDANNVIGLAPDTVEPLSQDASSDTDGLDQLLFVDGVGFADWLPISLTVTNLTTATPVLLEQLSVELVHYGDAVPRLHQVFDIYTGSYERGYSFHEITLAKARDRTHVFTSEVAANRIAKKYYDIGPGESDKFLLSITAEDTGVYRFRIVATYRIAGDVKRHQHDQLFTLYSMPEPIERRGVRVKISAAELERWSTRLASAKDALDSGNFAIQAGAFSTRSGAEELQQRIPPKYAAQILEEQRLYKVLIGEFKSRSEALSKAQILETLLELDLYVRRTPTN